MRSVSGKREITKATNSRYCGMDSDKSCLELKWVVVYDEWIVFRTWFWRYCVISECFPISSKDVKNSALFCTNEIKLKWSDIGSGKSFGKWIVHYNWVISQKGLICGFVLLLKVSPVEKALRIRVWRSEILLICAKIFIQFHDFIFTVLAGNFCYNACKRSMYMTLYQYGMFCCEWTTTLEGKDKGSAIIQAVFVYI